MKTPFFVVACLMLVGAIAQKHAEPRGVIYGIATTQDGHPAKGIKLTVDPIGDFILGSVLPSVTTNQAGEYRIENLQLLSYRVYAEDQDGGYSSFSTGFGSGSVTLTSEDPTAEYRVSLPPRAGFLQIHLTNRRTGAGIPAIRIVLTLAEKPEMRFTSNAYSNAAILVPPDKDLLLHVVSDGFAEWEESLGAGKPINLASGSRLTLDVQLEPLKH